jgi:hypothetical protein
MPQWLGGPLGRLTCGRGRSLADAELCRSTRQPVGAPAGIVVMRPDQGTHPNIKQCMSSIGRSALSTGDPDVKLGPGSRRRGWF